MRSAKIEGLGHDALAGKCRIAVDQQWQVFLPAVFSGAILLGAGAAHGHRIDSFQMAGIRNQVDVNLRARASDVLAGRAHVVFHIAAAQNAARIDVFKPGKYLLGRAPGNVHDHIQAAAMAHAHHQIHRAALAGSVENLVHQRDQSGDAFERKTLVAEIALLQHLFEQIGTNQLVENVLLIHSGLRAFQTLLDPAPPRGIGNVHELGADGSAIDPAGFLSEFAIDTQFGMRHRRQKAERIEISFEDIPSGGKDRKRVHGRRLERPDVGGGSFTGSFGSGGHISTTRITDDADVCWIQVAARDRVRQAFSRDQPLLLGNAFINKPFSRIVMTDAASVAW